MPQVEKKPFHTSEEVEEALNLIQFASENGVKLRIIADLTLHTGATLSDILGLTNGDFAEGATFSVQNNPNRSYTLKSYWSFGQVMAIRNARVLQKKGKEGKFSPDYEAPFFTNKGKIFTEGYIRSTYSKISARTGKDISLIRFRKTFYLDYLIRNGSVYGVAPEATKDTRFTNDEYIAEKLGLGIEEYTAAKKGKWEPIIDARNEQAYTDDMLLDSINKLEERVSEMKYMIEQQKQIPSKAGQPLITNFNFMSEMLEKIMYGRKLKDGEVPNKRRYKGG